jgi:hypothetical protein
MRVREGVARYLPALLVQIVHELLEVIDDGKGLRTRMTKVPVHVFAGQRAAVVADDDAVRIEHGNDLEDQVRAQLLAGERERRGERERGRE